MTNAPSLRAVGIDEPYAADLAFVGYTNLTPAHLEQLRALQIDSTFIKRAAAHGFPHLTIDKLIQARATGVF